MKLALALQSPSAILRNAREARRNLWNYTEEFNQSVWTKIRAPITPNVDGVADRWTEDTTASNTHILARLDSGADNTVHTFQGKFKPEGRSRFSLNMIDADATANFVSVNVDLGAVTAAFATSGGAGVPSGTPTVTLLGDGYYLVVVSGTPNPGGSGGFLFAQFRLADATGNTVYTGDGVSGILIKDFQLEAGSSATAYQPIGATF